MLAALTLAAATALPTIAISVHASPHVSRSVVTSALEEARDIWLGVGVRVSWRTEEVPAAEASVPDAVSPLALRVVIDDDRGADLGPGLAIGWVIFHDDEPTPEIHLSYGNAFRGLERCGPVGALAALTKVRIDEVVAVALGRALAHEIGHYLLGRNSHASSGLMRPEWSPSELFGENRPPFRLDAAQRTTIRSKLQTQTPVPAVVAKK